MCDAFPANATQAAPDDLQGLIAAAVTENCVGKHRSRSPANGVALLWSSADGMMQPVECILPAPLLLFLPATRIPSWRKQFQLGKEEGLMHTLKVPERL